jgi:tetratricopeptide (TPR) repeat protein
MARNLESDMETLRTVLRLAQERDFVRAAALSEQTLAGGFEHPLLLNVVATLREQEGKLDQALALLERAVAIAPADVGARNALALCLQRLDRPADALVHLDVLLQRHPELSFAHASKGNALIALGFLKRARESHARAVELDPKNLAAVASLASIATHMGQHAEARRWAERTFELAPGYPDAVLSLAAAESAEGNLPAAESRLRALIQDTRAGPSDRARATGQLGDVLDAGGRYAEAFEAYQAGNQALRQINRRFAAANALGYMRASTAAVERLDAGQWKRVPDGAAGGSHGGSHGGSAGGAAGGSVGGAAGGSAGDAAGHVFLVGFPRSGTTLLDAALDGSPRVASLEEHELLTEGVLAFMREPVAFEPLARAGEDSVASLREAYWRRVRGAGIDVADKIFVDKHPLNSVKLPLIAKVFPDAKILFAVRDPRDVVLSCFRRRFRMNPSMFELLTLPGAAAFYAAVMEFAHAARRRLEFDWHEVRYERLAGDFPAEMRRVCDAIGLEWTSAMADFAGRAEQRDHATPSTAQLAQGLVTSHMGQWRNYELELRPQLPVLAPWIEGFGY